LLKSNNGSKHRQALDQLFYDVMEEKVSCAIKKGENVINTFDVDVRETEVCFFVEAELPGFTIASNGSNAPGCLISFATFSMCG